MNKKDKRAVAAAAPTHFKGKPSDREIRQDVEWYANCRAYGPSTGVVDEATAAKKLRETRARNVIATPATTSDRGR
eukprot:4838687-Pleurochrysis_carterae.AAC.1